MSSPTQHASKAETAGVPSVASLADVTVVIPIGPDETEFPGLVDDLDDAAGELEIILVGVNDEGESLRQWRESQPQACSVRWLTTRRGRACQLNAGVSAATRTFVWLLHADTRVAAETVAALRTSLDDHADSLHYFDLKFLGDGPWLTRLNALGTWFRSHWLKMPFGDQGFCLAKPTLERLGGFDEDAAYGEDHLLVWAARRAGIRIHPVGAVIETSARKYRQQGWLRVTLKHMWLTWRQAIPQWWRLVWRRKL